MNWKLQIDSFNREIKSGSYTNRLIYLDFLRGVAALAVFLGHMRMIFLVRYHDVSPEITIPCLLLKLVYLLTGFHHHAVVIFFVLSGFFIASSVMKVWQKHCWSWNIYLVNRLTRLWLVLIPALVIGAFWDYLGTAIFPNSTVYQSARIAGFNQLSWISFFGNAFFLQDILFSTFGSNISLWSLSYEFWYYILFPIILISLSSQTPKQKRIFYSLTGIFLLVVLGQRVRLYFPIWLMGAAISQMRPINFFQAPRRAKITCFIIFISFLATIAGIRSQQYESKSSEEMLGDYIVGVATSVLIYAGLHLKPIASSSLYSKTSVTLADFSYTLYLVHMPLLFFLASWLAPTTFLQPTVTTLGLMLLMTITVLIYAFFISRFTEAKTDSVRNIVMHCVKLGHSK